MTKTQRSQVESDMEDVIINITKLAVDSKGMAIPINTIPLIKEFYIIMNGIMTASHQDNGYIITERPQHG